MHSYSVQFLVGGRVVARQSIDCKNHRSAAKRARRRIRSVAERLAVDPETVRARVAGVRATVEQLPRLPRQPSRLERMIADHRRREMRVAALLQEYCL